MPIFEISSKPDDGRCLYIDDYCGSNSVYFDPYDLVELSPSEMAEAVMDIMGAFRAAGAKVEYLFDDDDEMDAFDDFEGPFAVVSGFTEDVKLSFFKKAHEQFRQRVAEMTLQEFATSQNAVESIAVLIGADDTDFVYRDGTTMTLCQFVREANPVQEYYFGNVISI